jgi:hypothetical protein
MCQKSGDTRRPQGKAPALKCSAGADLGLLVPNRLGQKHLGQGHPGRGRPNSTAGRRGPRVRVWVNLKPFSIVSQRLAHQHNSGKGSDAVLGIHARVAADSEVFGRCQVGVHHARPLLALGRLWQRRAHLECVGVERKVQVAAACGHGTPGDAGRARMSEGGQGGGWRGPPGGRLVTGGCIHALRCPAVLPAPQRRMAAGCPAPRASPVA